MRDKEPRRMGSRAAFMRPSVISERAMIPPLKEEPLLPEEHLVQPGEVVTISSKLVK